MKRVALRITIILFPVFAFILTSQLLLAAVTLSSFNAKWVGGTVAVTWNTATELDNAGFKVLRSTTSNGTYADVSGFVASQCNNACVTGASYSFNDTNVTAGQTYYYKLQAIDNANSTQLFGPVIATPVPAPNRKVYLPLIKASSGTTGVVTILSNHFAYDVYGNVVVLGEVQNLSTSHIRDVKVAVNFFDVSNNLMGSDWTTLYLPNLPSGQKSCFHTGSLSLSNWSYYTFDAPVYSTNGRNFRALTVLSKNGYYNPTSGDYAILGQVRNDSNASVFAQVVGTLYNSSGKIIGCSSYHISGSLGVNQTGSFDLQFWERDYKDVTNFIIQADDAFP